MKIVSYYEKAVKSRFFLSYKINKAIINVVYPFIRITENGTDKSSDIILSLTSHPGRIKVVHLTVKTLLRQTLKPKTVILWLASDQFPGGEKELPKKLLGLKKYGLEIRFCDNLYSHKKYYYAMKEYPNNKIITADDDVFYPENLVENLSKLSEKYPNTVCCNWCNRFALDDDGDVYSYEKWSGIDETPVPSIEVFPVGIGGVLYPPGALNSEVLNREAIEETCISADDLWLKAMAVMNRTKAVKVPGQTRIYFSIVNTKKTGLYHANVGDSKSPDSWRNIMEKYPRCREILIEEISGKNQN